jgi:hypothetical protein
MMLVGLYSCLSVTYCDMTPEGRKGEVKGDVHC